MYFILYMYVPMSSHNYEETGMTTLTLWVKLWVDDIHIQSETEKE